MIQLSLKHSLKPFSHSFGQKVLFPSTDLICQIFPNLILISKLGKKDKAIEVKLDVKAFIEDFTLETDYQKNALRVFGKAEGSFLEYILFISERGLEIKLKRFESKLKVDVENQAAFLKKGDTLVLSENVQFLKQASEKLFLGVSKKQDMDEILKRKDLQEMLPYIFHMGQAFDEIEPLTIDSLEEIRRLIVVKTDGFFVPTLENPHHIDCEFSTNFKKPQEILSSIYHQIKQKLVKEEKDALILFSSMFKPFVAGKAFNLKFSDGFIHMEWTKGFLRQVIIVLNTDRPINIRFAKNVKSFRLRKEGKALEAKTICEKGIYHIDRFLA